MYNHNIQSYIYITSFDYVYILSCRETFGCETWQVYFQLTAFFLVHISVWQCGLIRTSLSPVQVSKLWRRSLGYKDLPWVRDRCTCARCTKCTNLPSQGKIMYYIDVSLVAMQDRCCIRSSWKIWQNQMTGTFGSLALQTLIVFLQGFSVNVWWVETSKKIEKQPIKMPFGSIDEDLVYL